MNLNGNSRFSLAPRATIERSIFDRSHSHKTTFNAGDLVPVYLEEVLPGDTVSMDVSSICRMTTPLYPVMDNSYLDFHWFFVPMRLVWDHWKEFCGESADPWAQQIEYEIPHYNFEVTEGGFWDHIGVPINGWRDVSVLPWRAYCLIWNEWFRDQNLQENILVDKSDSGYLDFDYLLKVNKYKDYFTSCLPSPQKGVSVSVPLGDWAPVKVRNVSVYGDGETVGYPISFRKANVLFELGAVPNGSLGLTDERSGVLVDSNNYSSHRVTPTNLWADLSNAIAPTINDLRQAFAVQRLLEADARGGTRYRELVKAHFGVDTGDARVQVPEYLGGKHIPINVSQVVQTSNTNDDIAPTYLGYTGAVSKTVDRGSVFTKSFTEHGYLFGLCSVRTDHTYQQGIPRFLSRRDRYDFYWPELANIGEQAVKVSELYADADPEQSLVFGYQEAWADYRYSPNRVTGGFRSDSLQTLDGWHYADFYENRPYLSSDWVQETSDNIARTLRVTDMEVADQFLLDCYFKARWARPLPVYSVPGLSGHF